MATVGALALVAPASSGAVTVSPGDILLADYAAGPGTQGTIYDVNPVTGAATVVSQAGQFDVPRGLARMPDGTLLVADSGAQKFFRVDPSNGAQTRLFTAPAAEFPVGVAVAADNNVYVLIDAATPLVQRVDPSVSDAPRTTVASGGNLNTVTQLAADPNGTLLLGDYTTGPMGNGALIRIDPANMGQQIISQDGIFRGVQQASPARGGSLLVSNSGGGPGDNGIIVRVDPTTGAQTRISDGGQFMGGLGGIAQEANGQIVVPDEFSKKLFRIDPSSGAQSVISADPTFDRPFAVVVVPDPPATTIRVPSADGTVSDARPIFAFTSNQESSTFECRFDQAAFAACSSPFTGTNLTSGPHTFVVRATNAGNQIEPTASSRSLTVDATLPTVKSFKASPKRFAAASASIAKKRKAGTRFSFKLSEKAKVTIEVRRARCTKRQKKKNKCGLGSLNKTAKQGSNRIRFSGKLRKKKLKSGSYRATLVATDSVGNKSKAASTKLRIVKPR